MKTLYLNDTGDIELDNLYNLKLVEADEEARQRNRLTLTTRKEEWFLNLQFGIPWMELLGKKVTLDEIKQEIINALEADDAIESIDSIELDFDNAQRDLQIDIEGTLSNGNDFQQTLEV